MKLKKVTDGIIFGTNILDIEVPEHLKVKFKSGLNYVDGAMGGEGFTPSAVTLFTGTPGAGKTTLSRGFMRAFGYTGAVKSPTYTLVEPYEFKLCNIYHFDLYRLADPQEVAYLGTDEYFTESNLCLVEWAEKGAKWLPGADLVIDMADQGTGRRLACQSLTEKGAIIAKRLWP